jgi:hypothetical protein
MTPDEDARNRANKTRDSREYLTVPGMQDNEVRNLKN